jgi:hypothetical protein
MRLQFVAVMVVFIGSLGRVTLAGESVATAPGLLVVADSGIEPANDSISDVTPSPSVVPAVLDARSANVVATSSGIVKKIAPKIRNVATPRRIISATGNVGRVHAERGDWRFLYDEARNLLVPDQKYLIQYEDEENYGKAAGTGKNSQTVVFSPEDVEKFKKAVQTVADYRNQMRNHCPSPSAASFMQSLDKYANSLCAFNRRALPLVADISENNSLLRLLVSRTSLKDAPVLVSRYLQFKKQRFKDSMDKFVPADRSLVEAMVTIANVLKVELNNEDWNRPYGLRDNSVEVVSLWPRESIFEASAKLTESRESACIVRNSSPSIPDNMGKVQAE